MKGSTHDIRIGTCQGCTSLEEVRKHPRQGVLLCFQCFRATCHGTMTPEEAKRTWEKAR